MVFIGPVQFFKRTLEKLDTEINRLSFELLPFCPTLHRKMVEKEQGHNTKTIEVFCMEGVTLSLLHKSQFCVCVYVCVRR